MTKYSIVHETYFDSRTLVADLDLEAAKIQVELIARTQARMHDDGLGQSIIEESWPLKRPYQIVVKTMTAEAGECLDVYAVVLQEPLSNKPAANDGLGLGVFT